MKKLQILVAMIAALLCAKLQAQDLPNDQKAIFCFDLKVDELLNSDLAKSMGEGLVEMIQDEMQFPQPPNKYTRVFGMMGAPNSMQDLMAAAGPSAELPFGMYFEFQMVDEDSAQQLLSGMDLDEDNTTEHDGVTYFSPPEYAPQNVVGGIKDSKTVVLGTKEYVFAESRKDLFTDELKAVWGKQGGAPIRLSLELKSKMKMVQELVAMGKSEAPPMMAPMLDLIDNIESANLMIDPSGKEMIVLNGFGVSDDEAKELRGGLDGMLAMGKMMATGQMDGLEVMPNVKEAVDSVMGDLKIRGDGNEVNLIINRPETMDEALEEFRTIAVVQAKKMQRMNNLRMVGLSMHNYYDVRKKFPFDAEANNRNADLSWRVAVLPYLEQNRLYDEMDLEKGCDEAPNSEFADSMPELFGADGKNSNVAFIRLDNPPKGFQNIIDGTSNTLCLIEYPAGIPWLENKDLSIDEVVELLGSLEGDETLVGITYDGAAHTFRAGLDEQLIRNLCDPADGNVVDFDAIYDR